jgi:hypothetical protein
MSTTDDWNNRQKGEQLMHKSRVVLVCMALALMLALLIPLVGCKGGGTAATPTPAGTTTGATATPTHTTTATKTSTPTKTPTATATSKSGQTLSDVYGKGYKGDVKYDAYMTIPGMPSPQLMYKVSIKGWNSANSKTRYDIPAAYPGGFTEVIIWDSSTGIQYDWYPGQHVACQVPTGQGQDNPEKDVNQIVPVKDGTETIDGNLCDIYQWTYGGQTMKEWIWRAKSFPIRQQYTTSGQTVTMDFKNIDFNALSDDLFTVPSNELQPYPCSPK